MRYCPYLDVPFPFTTTSVLCFSTSNSSDVTYPSVSISTSVCKSKTIYNPSCSPISVLRYSLHARQPNVTGSFISRPSLGELFSPPLASQPVGSSQQISRKLAMYLVTLVSPDALTVLRFNSPSRIHLTPFKIARRSLGLLGGRRFISSRARKTTLLIPRSTGSGSF